MPFILIIAPFLQVAGSYNVNSSVMYLNYSYPLVQSQSRSEGVWETYNLKVHKHVHKDPIRDAL